MIRLRRQCLESPDDKQLEERYEDALEYVNSRYDNIMRNQIRIPLQTEGAITMQDIERMTPSEREYTIRRLNEYNEERKKLLEGR